MARGFIDAVTSSGTVEGWAFEENRPNEPLLISIVDSEDSEVALGLANLYRRDLADVRYAYGWCFYRLRLNKPVSLVKNTQLKLVSSPSKDLLFGPRSVQYLETRDHVAETIQEIIAADPTVLGSLEQIDGCDEIFENFIKARGLDAFVRAAYVYVLGRSIDSEGLILYNRLIRQKRLTPYAMLRTLADSAEFRTCPRSLVAPNSPGFPFRTDP